MGVKTKKEELVEVRFIRALSNLYHVKIKFFKKENLGDVTAHIAAMGFIFSLVGSCFDIDEVIDF